MNEPHRFRAWWMVTILLLSAALFWHDLGVREVLGRDENLTITKLDQPNLGAVLEATRLKATGQPGNMQPLYFLLQYPFWPLVDHNAFVLRFLPTLFAILAVAFTYRLGGALWGGSPLRDAAWIGALLTALLPLMVRYAQIIRPYTLLALLSLASAYFLLRALQTHRPWLWVGFTLTAVLNFYTHYNALFVLAVEGLYTALWGLMALVQALKQCAFPHRLAGIALAWLIVVLLCLPGLLRLWQLPGVSAANRAQVELTFAFFHRFLHKIGLPSPWQRGFTLAAMGLGLAATLYLRRWWATLFTGLWLAVPFLLLAVRKLPRPFAERYVIFVPPVALLLAGAGLAALAWGLGALGRRRKAALTGAVAMALAVGLALFFLAPLRAGYAANRAADRLERTIRVIEDHAQPGDLVIVSPRFFVRPLHTPAQALFLSEHLTPDEFDRLLADHPRTWVLYTSYLPSPRLQEPLDRWIQSRQDEFVRVPIKAITALAFYSREPRRAEDRLEEQIAILTDLAAVSADAQEAWLRHEALAQAHEALADLLDRRGEQALAAEHRKEAEDIRAAAPRPW